MSIRKLPLAASSYFIAASAQERTPSSSRAWKDCLPASRQSSERVRLSNTGAMTARLLLHVGWLSEGAIHPRTVKACWPGAAWALLKKYHAMIKRKNKEFLYASKRLFDFYSGLVERISNGNRQQWDPFYSIMNKVQIPKPLVSRGLVPIQLCLQRTLIFRELTPRCG